MLGIGVMDNDLATLFYIVAFVGCLVIAFFAAMRKLPEICALAAFCACGFLPLAWNALAS